MKAKVSSSDALRKLEGSEEKNEYSRHHVHERVDRMGDEAIARAHEARVQLCVPRVRRLDVRRELSGTAGDREGSGHVLICNPTAAQDIPGLVSYQCSAHCAGTSLLPGGRSMSDMGTFRTSVGIENMARRGNVMTLPDVLVDTGAEATWIPRAVLESLSIVPERSERYQLADGRVLERDVGFAVVHVAGTTAADHVVFAEPGDLVLLGARSLEGLNLRVDPRRKQLVSAGPIVAAPAA